MIRSALVSLFLFLLASSARASADQDVCRKEYVVPYAEQCAYGYKTLKKDTSPSNLSLAFNACARAQSVALACLKDKSHDVHVVALSAAYSDVSYQAEIALFAQQYTVAEALLREKLNILDVAKAEAKPGDRTVERERASTKRDLADSLAGQCTTRALASAPQQRTLARAHKYGDLATLLKKKSDDYARCARLTTSPAKRAYVEYIGFVALEESGRAAQADGKKDDANALYQTCIDGANHSAGYAVAPVKGYLGTVSTLCAGRMNGKYAVDQPEPLDSSTERAFRPLTLPKS